MTDQDRTRPEMPNWQVILRVAFCSVFMLLAGSYAFGYLSHGYLRYFVLCIYATALLMFVLIAFPLLLGAIPARTLDRQRLDNFSMFWLRWYPLPLIASYLASLAYVKSFPSAGLVE
ncbi:MULTISPECIES: hypothetical protein [unclassified Mesorhizobium]|uniref:hypothetical protein n=1 Tax=unclassified Mesorhizobium TaxID=325217 RepID=UPI0012DC7F7C|nr:hypothetical protein [Mesorhizobium sp. L103C105A0]